MCKSLNWIFGVLTLTASVGASGQIEISTYPKQFKCAIDALDQLEPPQASSPCGELKIEVKDQIFSGGCLGTLNRNYIFTDPCGNKSTADMYILLTDNDPPVLYGVPSDMETAQEGIPAMAMVSARDNCGELIEVSSEERRNGNQIVRSWTATDPCGNSTVRSQTITLK